MRDWIGELVEESLNQYRLAWALMARSSTVGAVIETDNIAFTIAGVPIPLFNAAFAKHPLGSLSELVDLGSEAMAEFSRLGVPGMLTMPSSWLPEGGEARLTELGLSAETRFMGMRTGRLNEPRWNSRTLDLRELHGQEAANAVAAINGEAYGMPEDLWRHLELPALWKSPARAYAIYEQEKPVAVGASATLDAISYIMWMATLPGSRGKGYAEAIIRRAWQDAREQDGVKISVLHATQMGQPIYSRLGYTAVAEFPGFVWQLT